MCVCVCVCVCVWYRDHRCIVCLCVCVCNVCTCICNSWMRACACVYMSVFVYLCVMCFRVSVMNRPINREYEPNRKNPQTRIHAVKKRRDTQSNTHKIIMLKCICFVSFHGSWRCTCVCMYGCMYETLEITEEKSWICVKTNDSNTPKHRSAKELWPLFLYVRDS